MRVLERDQPFSASLLWAMQRRFFTEHGAAAWTTGGVPHQITTNPRIAEALARVVLGHVRDRARVHADADARTYIVELGAGAGRFAHHFLAHLAPRLDAAGLGDRVTYVMTDTVPALIEHWRAHPKLRPHVARGALDFAIFDAAAPGPLDLVERGVRLAPDGHAAPLVVIANYLFDSIPCDCFSTHGGTLAAGLLTLRARRRGADPTDPALLPTLALEVTPVPLDVPAYYGEPLDSVLVDCAARVPDATFTFPIAALRALAYLRDLGGGSALALVADRGLADPRALAAAQEPALALHGSFSVRVNFDALAAYARATGGFALTTPHREPHLEIAALGLGPLGPAPETARAYVDAIAEGGPMDAFVLDRDLARDDGLLALPALLAHLRLSRWDSHVFARCADAFVARLPDASDDQRAALAYAAARVEAAHYAIDGDDDLVDALARVRAALGPGRR